MVFNQIRNLHLLPVRQPKVRTLSNSDVVVRVPQKAIRNQKHFQQTLSKFGLVGARFIDKRDNLCFIVHSKEAAKDRSKFADSIRFAHRAKLSSLQVTAAYV